MASKKVQISFELTTEKEWREFIQRPGLLVIDLFRDWAGPCVAMSTPLKNLKTSEQAFEWMQLASAPSSIAPELRRLEGSRPTFVLLSGRRLVNVVFGCNAPEVVRIIAAEVEREKRAAQGMENRRTVSLTRLSPAEVALQEQLLGSEGDRMRAERAQAELEADRVQRRILGQIAEHLPTATVVVVFPYALQSDACVDILAALRESWAEMGFAVTREEEVELGQDAVDLMFWERRLPQHDVLADSVTQGASLVLMLDMHAPDDEEDDDEEQEEGVAFVCDVEATIAKTIYGFLPGTGSSMELITPVDGIWTPELAEGSETKEEEGEEEEEDVGRQEDEEEDEGMEESAEEDNVEAETPREAADEGQQEGAKDEREEVATEDEVEGRGLEPKQNEDEEDRAEPEEDEGLGLSVALEGDDDDLIPQAPVRVWNPRELLPALDSAAARLLFRRDDQGPVLPGVWTPLTALSKAAAVKALFEDVAEPLYQPPTPPPPPPPESTVICFAGDKRDEVLELSEKFPTDVTRFGFFTKSRKLLAASHADYERLVRSGLQTAKTLVVLEVTRVRSAPLLELATAGPLYISATPALAKADVDEFFGARATRASPDDLREIVKGREEEEDEEDAVPEPARPRAKEAEGAAAGAAEARGTGEVEAGEPSVGEGAELGEVIHQEVPAAEHGLGDGEVQQEAALPEMGEAVAEEQLLSGAGEGDAPTVPAADADGGVEAGDE